MSSNELADIIAQSVRGVSIVPRDEAVVLLEGSIGAIARNLETRELIPEVGKNSGHGHAAGTRYSSWAGIIEENVIAGVAEDKLIEQSG